jgi:hypothetical protein
LINGKDKQMKIKNKFLALLLISCFQGFGQNDNNYSELVCRFIDIVSRDSFPSAEPSEEVNFYCDSGSFKELVKVQRKRKQHQITEISNDTVAHLVTLTEKGIQKTVGANLSYASSVKRPKICSKGDQEQSSNQNVKGLVFSLDYITYKWRLIMVDEEYYIIEVFRGNIRKRSSTFKSMYYMVLKRIE